MLFRPAGRIHFFCIRPNGLRSRIVQVRLRGMVKDLLMDCHGVDVSAARAYNTALEKGASHRSAVHNVVIHPDDSQRILHQASVKDLYGLVEHWLYISAVRTR